MLKTTSEPLAIAQASSFPEPMNRLNRSPVKALNIRNKAADAGQSVESWSTAFFNCLQSSYSVALAGRTSSGR